MKDAVLFRTHGQLSFEAILTINRFSRDLSNDQLALIHNGQLGWWTPKLAQFKLRHCSWQWDDFLSRYPALVQANAQLPEFNQASQSTGKRWLSPHFAVLAPVVLFHTRALNGTCNDLAYSPAVGRLWSVEQDALYNGRLDQFVSALQAVNADLLSTGYIAADSDWWGYALHTKTPYLRPKVHTSAANFTCVIRAARSVCTDVACNVLTSAQACPKNGVGFLFRVVVVERFSASLLSLVHDNLQRGVGMVGEVFASTLCDSHPGCILKDWQVELNSRFFSENFIWNPRPVAARPGPVRIAQNRWAHPIKWAHPHVAALPSQTSSLETKLRRENPNAFLA